MATYQVNPATVAATGLKLRSAPRIDPETLLGVLSPGDLVASTGPQQDAPPLVWLPVRVESSATVASGSSGFAALSNAGDVYLIPHDASASNPLCDAAAQSAGLLELPALLIKAFIAVEGAAVGHRDGVLQVIPSTRAGVIARISRTGKLAALGAAANPADADLNAQFAQAFDSGNLNVQVLTGAQYIREQLDQFNGIVALAGLAYNAGPGGARSVIDSSGGDPYTAAAQYHRTIGTAAAQVTVQVGIGQIDPATGSHYTRYPVTANDTGREIFDYQYLRQVPARNFGLLDFIEQPRLLARLNLYQNDASPGSAGDGQVLAAAGGAFRFAPVVSNTAFTAPPLSQRDPQWRDQALGFGDPTTTIGTDGCTLTCLAMLADGFGAHESPDTLNQKLKALGPNSGFAGALVVWAGLPAALPGISLRRIVTCADRPAPMGEIDAALDGGMPVVVELDQSPAPGFSNHWVLLAARQAGDYRIHDPWPAPAEPGASLNSRYGFAGAPAQIVNAAVFYIGPTAPLPPSAPQPQPFIVVVMDTPDIALAGGLALRDAPVTGVVKTRLPAGTPLMVQEPPDAARAKLGQSGQWLQVSAPGAIGGFVAAWLVQAAASKDAELAAPPPLTRPTATASLAEQTQRPLARTAPLIVTVVAPASRRARRVLLRAGSAHGKVLAALPPGTRLRVIAPAPDAREQLGRRGVWLRVADEAGRQGYVSAQALRATAADAAHKHFVPFMAAAKLVPVPKTVNAMPALVEVIDDADIAAAGGLNLRAAPVDGTALARLPAGARLFADETDSVSVGQAGRWLRVRTADGVAGCVPAWYIRPVQRGA